MADRIYYNKAEKSWNAYVTINNKEKVFSYRESIYQEYAKVLAEQSLKEKRRFENIIEIKKDYAIMKIYSKTFGWNIVYIDIEDIEKVNNIKWGINEGYAYNYTYGAMHRYILNLERTPQNENEYVDHINRNRLDNRKSNLRLVDNSINQKNKKCQSNNTSGIPGVRKMYTNTSEGWIAKVSMQNKTRITKFFASNKYGDEIAKELAIAWRDANMKKYGYINYNESSTTIESKDKQVE